MSREYVTVTVEKAIRESESGLAVLLRINDMSIWMPRSQMHASEEVEVGREDFELEVTEWIAKKADLL